MPYAGFPAPKPTIIEPGGKGLVFFSQNFRKKASEGRVDDIPYLWLFSS
jgi:hypothetical protein